MMKGERRHQGSGQEQRQRRVLRANISDCKQVIIPGGKAAVGGVSCLLHCKNTSCSAAGLLEIAF